jgi:hypothetical protein
VPAIARDVDRLDFVAVTFVLTGDAAFDEINQVEIAPARAQYRVAAVGRKMVVRASCKTLDGRAGVGKLSLFEERSRWDRCFFDGSWQTSGAARP